MYTEYGYQKFVPIVYHISDALANSYSNERRAYYGVNATPWTVIDGIRVTNYTYSGVKPFVDARLSVNRPMTINVNAIYNKTTQYMKVTATVKLESSIKEGTWYLRLFVSENDVYGSYDFVLRSMDRTLLTIRNANEEQKYEWEFYVDSSWTVENMMAGAFVQNDDEKFSDYNVYQASMVPSITITNNIDTTSIGVIKAILR
ncbi:MAG: hypothetical protein ACUVWP_07295 [bacterium]